MGDLRIDLTDEEKQLLAKIRFEPIAQEATDSLMKSLIARNAIPEVRWRFFSDPDFNPHGKRSHLQIFEDNGTRGDAIFRHPHFVKYLHYFLNGPDLPMPVIERFRQAVSECGDATSGDIVPIGKFAKKQTRENGLEPKRASEEFYKLALECNLDLSAARSIRNSVKSVRK